MPKDTSYFETAGTRPVWDPDFSSSETARYNDYDQDNVKVINEDLNDDMELLSEMDKNPDSFVNDNQKLTYEEAYRNYRQNPNVSNLNKVIHSLGDTINYSLASNNASGDPLLEAKAKLITAKAVKEFDPGYKVSLPTYVSSQLRKMTRLARDLRNPIKIPERYIYELQNLQQAEKDFIEEHGREPDLTELSDETGMSIKKILDIRKKSLKQVSEQQGFTNVNNEDDSASSIDETAAVGPDFLEEAQTYVYYGLDHRQKKVFEHLTGFGGAKVLSPAQISQKYKVSLPTISRMAKRFAKEISENYDALESVYAK